MAVCNEVGEAGGEKGFGSLPRICERVLRNVARNLDNVSYPEDPVDNLSIRYSMPRWILGIVDSGLRHGKCGADAAKFSGRAASCDPVQG